LSPSSSISAEKSCSSSSRRRARDGLLVEELDVEIHARHRIDAGFGDLVLLDLGQRLAFFFLRRQRGAEKKAQNKRSENAHDGIPPALLFKHSDGRRAMREQRKAGTARHGHTATGTQRIAGTVLMGVF
jgi:hypothetical protein